MVGEEEVKIGVYPNRFPFFPIQIQIGEVVNLCQEKSPIREEGKIILILIIFVVVRGGGVDYKNFLNVNIIILPGGEGVMLIHLK